MITEQKIKELAEQKIAGSTAFIVDIHVSPANKITVLLDDDKGISINDCIQLSRHIEAGLNRDVEDFELTVSSPGLDQPLRSLRQYRKYVGKLVEVLTKDGIKLSGSLKEVDEQGIVLEEKHKEKVEGKKSKQLVTTIRQMPFNEIKETKIVISF